ncbi:uncharacterized protein LOC112270721 [Brachypodium distachyon]|uniref:uncharacterized protein LOC112270721 n=1 Tax=Brachypodium distachyon TaxID=15368 RepID=UPI000D0D8561|nr:uncharacterized protein LOC112270721 [Brachypodium distachyon]|eukprot:XP_024314547.1 uncharacterized protein LOC112270721 [Brachypodium distachyon]
MTHRRCFECLDRSLRDILSQDNVSNAALDFGGLPIMLGGDFRQVLPVLPGSLKSEVLDAAICSSPLWREVKVFKLHDNMRLQSDKLSETDRLLLSEFAQWVLDVGDGVLRARRYKDDPERVWVDIPDRFLIKVSAIVGDVYHDFVLHHDNMDYLAGRAIICPTNAVVDEINEYVTSMVPSEETEYLSADRIAPCSEQVPNVDVLFQLSS